MPNGCDMPRKDVDPECIKQIKQKHNIPDTVPVFIYAGRMIWYKNIQYVLEACRILKQKGKSSGQRTAAAVLRSFGFASFPVYL